LARLKHPGMRAAPLSLRIPLGLSERYPDP